MAHNRYFFLKKSHGNAAIEFAIVLPVVLLLLSGVINFGLILVNKNQLNTVAASGTLFSFGNSSDPTLVKNTMDSTTNLSPLTTTATTFCECLDGTPVAGCSDICADGNSPNKYVTVTAQSQVSLIAPAFVLDDPFITQLQATIRTEK